MAHECDLGRLPGKLAGSLVMVLLAAAIVTPALAAPALQPRSQQAALNQMRLEATLQAEAEQKLALEQRHTAVVVASILGGAIVIAAVVVRWPRRRR